MKPAAATPAARTSWPDDRSLIIPATASTMAAGSPAGVGLRRSARIWPDSETSAPAIFVPLMSIPMACMRDNPSVRGLRVEAEVVGVVRRTTEKEAQHLVEFRQPGGALL